MIFHYNNTQQKSHYYRADGLDKQTIQTSIQAIRDQAIGLFLQKKSHAYEKGGAQLSISFSHLLMDLNNTYVFEKTVEMGQ